jgi:hypothetical protein
MAIDAMMFVWVRGRENWLDRAKLRRLSYLLASTTSFEDFLIRARLPGAKLDDGHVLELCERDEEDRPVWIFGDPEIVGARDDQFVKVNLTARYYDETYALGDWPKIRWVSEWLEHHFPGSEIFYGGDSGGRFMHLLTPERREQINTYFLEHGRREALRQIGSGFERRKIAAPVCEVCGVTPWVSGGGVRPGPEIVYFTCDGCGQQWVATRHETRQVPLGSTIETIADQLLKASKPA